MKGKAKMKNWIIGLFVAISIIFICPEMKALEYGEKVPELQVAKWIKGGPVKISAGGGKSFYVIEFWATWCPPCKITIPHLTELQKKYADKNFVMVGISAEDEKTVTEFSAAQKQMDYNVGVDDAEKTSKAYLGNESGIPVAFLVGNDGTLLWKGHPMELDKVIEAVLKGTFDLEIQKKVGVLHRKMQEAMQTENADELAKLSEEVLAMDPSDDLAVRSRVYVFDTKGEMEKAPEFISELQKRAANDYQLYFMKIDMLNQLNRPVEQKREEIQKTLNAFKDNPEVLNSLAWMIMDRLSFGTGSAKLALEAAKRSVEIIPKDFPADKRGYFINCLARAYYNAGCVAKALELETEAVKIVKDTDDEKLYSDTLNYYKEVMELSKTETSAGKK